VENKLNLQLFIAFFFWFQRNMKLADYTAIMVRNFFYIVYTFIIAKKTKTLQYDTYNTEGNLMIISFISFFSGQIFIQWLLRDNLVARNANEPTLF
jgi:hypothetical protein